VSILPGPRGIAPDAGASLMPVPAIWK